MIKELKKSTPFIFKNLLTVSKDVSYISYIEKKQTKRSQIK